MSRHSRENLKLAQNFPAISHAKSESDKNREQLAQKTRKHEKVVDGGQNWYIMGKKLENAHQEFKIDGREMTEEEEQAFKNGFMYIPISKAKDYAKTIVSAEDKENYDREVGFWFGKMRFSDLPVEFINNENAIYGFGKGFGYNGTAVGELPVKFARKKAFFLGYKDGIQGRAKEEEKENGKRR